MKMILDLNSLTANDCEDEKQEDEQEKEEDEQGVEQDKSAGNLIPLFLFRFHSATHVSSSSGVGGSTPCALFSQEPRTRTRPRVLHFLLRHKHHEFHVFAC